MANTFMCTLISDGVRVLLHEIGKTACKEQAEKIAARCGSGYESDVKEMPTRTIASAYTATTEAMADNLAHNTLAKAVRG